MKRWNIDDKTLAWVNAFNAKLDWHKAENIMDKLCFQPGPKSALLNHDPFKGLAEKPLMVINPNKKYKGIYIAAIIALIISLLAGIYLLIFAGLLGRTTYEQVIWPILVLIFLIPISLIFGLPSYFYFSCRRILFFSDRLVFTWLNLAGLYKSTRGFYYKDLSKAAVCTEMYGEYASV